MAEQGKLSVLACVALFFAVIGALIPQACYVGLILAMIFEFQNKKREVPLKGIRLAYWAAGLSVFWIFVRILYDKMSR